MQFNSILFICFLLVVVTIYYHLSARNRRFLLLMASYCFYWVWSIPFSGLLLGSTTLNYFAGRMLTGTSGEGKRKVILASAVIANLSVLALFKYVDFFSDSVYAAFGARLWPELKWVLPLGISFYTFQAMSYVIDVYRGKFSGRKSLFDVALYISFFPQLVAGPIVRADVLMPQLRAEHDLNWSNIRRGCALIIYGLAKKVFVADAMAGLVSEAYGSPESFSGLGLLLATYGFAVQIYCDFSAYSDIAIGAALLLGITLPTNFNKPYLACSIREFWQRWHISLSTWLRDYLYIPLGGNRCGKARTYLNLMITMLLGGLWHGAGWNWVAWGALHGGMMATERAAGVSAEPPKSRIMFALRWLLTLHLVCVSWVFFRAASVDQALLILQRIATFQRGALGVGIMPALYLAVIVLADFADLKRRWVESLDRRPAVARWVVYASGGVFALAFAGASNPEFIYFQF